MNRFKIVKILNLITFMVSLASVPSFAKGNKIAKKVEQKNEAPKDAKQKDDYKKDNARKLEDLVKEKQKELEKKRKLEAVVETKKEESKDNSNESSKKDDNKLLGKKRGRSKDAPENPTKLTGEFVNIAGFRCNKFITNKHGQTLYMCVGKPYNIFFEVGGYRYNESVNKGSVCFSNGITEERGELHLMEHISAEDSINVEWASRRVSSTNDEVGMNAFTYYLDEKNNIVEFELELKGKSIVDEKFIKELCGMLLGKKEFVEKFKRIFEGEKNRVISEMHGHQEGIEDGGTASILKTECCRIGGKHKFEQGGKWSEVKKLTYEDMWKFYKKNIVNGNPTVYFKFKDMEQAKKSLALFKKYYFDYKTGENCNLAKPGKNKLDDDFIKFKNVRKEFAENYRMFEIGVGEDGNKKTKKAKNLVEICYDIYDFDYWKKECIGCYNEDYFNNLPEIKEINKKYGFKGIKILGGGPKLLLSIYSDNRRILTEKKLKEIEKEIIDVIIGYIDRNEVKFEDLISARKLEMVKQIMKEKDFHFIKIANDINLSYMLEGKPFSKKYFRFNKNGELEHNPKVFEKYCKENYTKILKEALEETKRRIFVYEREEGNHDIIKDFVDDTSCRYLPLRVRPVNGKKNFDSKEEFAVAQGFVEEIIASLENKKWRGRFYSGLMHMSNVFNRFRFRPSSNLDIENFENVCKNELKAELKNLKLDDVFLNKKIDTYKKMVEKDKQSLLLTEKLLKEQQEKSIAFLNKEKISFKDIRKLYEKFINTRPLFEAIRVVKLDYNEKLKLNEILEKLDQSAIKSGEFMKEVSNKTKNGAMVLGKKAKQAFKETLKIEIEERKFILENIRKLLKGIEGIQNIKVNLNGKKGKITPEYIREIIKNVEFLDYDKVNKEEKEKDLEEIKKLKKKYRKKGIKQIEREVLKH